MAMKDALPSSFADSASPSHRSLRIFLCCFIFGLLLFLPIVQFDLMPQISMQQVQSLQLQLSNYLHRINPSQSSSQASSPSSSSSSSTSSPKSASFSLSPPTVLPPSSSSQSSPRIAICLVGGARAFELTGPTIKKYVLQAAVDSDVFVHAPLDKDSYKLSLLADGIPNLAHMRIFSPRAIPESRAFREALRASNSPNGIQGLLRYFYLVEGCLDMIKQYQLQHNLTYEWIIRTRLDGYWNNLLPSLETMNRTAYTVPIGSAYGGLNDRLGIGNWKTSEVALSRLSLVPLLHAHGARGLNSESAFKQQLKVRKIKHKQKGFPFCILSSRRYGWPPGRRGVPVLSLSSKGNLNGAKCRPCTPVSSGAAAKAIIEAQERSWAWPGTIKAPEMCNPSGGLQADWEEVFDRLAGPEKAKIRKSILNQNLADCIVANEALKKRVKVWDAPHTSEICERGLRTRT